MIISHSRKFIFIHIHKCGGTSAGKALSSLCRKGDISVGYKRFERNPTYKSLNKHSHASEVRQFVGRSRWNDYFKFAFVRNPYARAVSFYTWAQSLVESVSGAKKHLPLLRGVHQEIHQYPVVQAYLNTENFSEFIRHPDYHEDWGTDPQFRFISNIERNRIIVDEIGKIENFSRDFKQILDHISVAPSDTPILHLNQSSAKAYRKFYQDENDKKYIENLYSEDFKYLKYSFE